jgi:hypothetical protein
MKTKMASKTAGMRTLMRKAKRLQIRPRPYLLEARRTKNQSLRKILKTSPQTMKKLQPESWLS